MKKILTILLIVCNALAFAQGGAMADLKFEEAETAFSKNDYKATITKLNEFDKLYGSVTAKSLYLRIVSQNKLFVPNDLYENETQIDLLVSLRKNTSSYLKAMESEGLDDKFREVYDISEKLKRYPKDKAVWREQMEREERIAAEKIKIAEEKKQARLAKIKEYDVKKDQYYREIAPKIDAWEYKDGIKIGMAFDELKKTKNDWFKGHINVKAYPSLKSHAGSHYNKNYKEHYGDRLDEVEVLDDGKVYYYNFSIIRARYPVKTEIDKTINKLKAYFGETLVFDKIESGESKWYIIKSPYSKNKIVLQTYEGYNSNQVNIMKINDSWQGLYQMMYNNAVSSEDLDKYIGTYAPDLKYAVKKIDITKNDIQLIAQATGQSAFSLSHRDKDIYYYEKAKIVIEFYPEKGMLLLKQDGKEYPYTMEF